MTTEKMTTVKSHISSYASAYDDDFLGHLYDAVMAPAGFQVFIEKLAEIFSFESGHHGDPSRRNT